jgi:ATP-binding cassette subfamily C protein CydD
VFVGGATLGATTPLLVLIAGLAVIRTALLVGADALARSAARRTKGRLRADLTRHLFALGPRWTTRERVGELAGVVSGGLADVDAYITVFQPARVLAVAVPLLVLAVVLVLDPPTALVLLFTGPILVLLLGFIGGRARAITDRRFAEVRYLGAFFLDMLGGLATLKAFGRSREQVANIASISRQYGDTTMEVLRTAFQTSLVLEWGGAVAVALVAVEISLRLMDGGIAFDRALAVLIIVPEFFLPLRTLATTYHAGAAGRSVAERATAILDGPVPAHGRSGRAADAPAPAPAPAPADIRLTAVRFTYPGRETPALDGVDLHLDRGRVVALVGATGAGKTTIANLLLRFEQPDGGSIVVGDVPLEGIDLAAWRADVAWVPQRPYLFHGSIADNLRLARPAATDDELRSAVREAGAERFIDALPRGFATPVGDGGTRLSGGQRQRIAIARAFLADAWLVILDEATSHLDAESETVIRDAVRRLADQGRTVLVVSHRLRLAEIADIVAVLEAGRIVETGSPTDLAGRDGPYHRLLASRDDEDDAADDAAESETR